MNLKKIALLTGLVLSGITLSSVFAPVKAAGLTFNWSFTIEKSGVVGFPSYWDPDTLVSGTISGLNIGSNDGKNLTVYIPQAGFYSFAFGGTSQGGDAFIVDPKGNVTFADADFVPDAGTIGDNLYLGYGDGAGFSHFWGIDTIATSLEKTTFTLVNSAVPEPLNILGAITVLVLLGTVSPALKRRKVSK